MIDIFNYIGIIGLAWALSIFGINANLNKPFNCDVCLTFWLCLLNALIIKVFGALIFFYFTPLFILMVIKKILKR